MVAIPVANARNKTFGDRTGGTFGAVMVGDEAKIAFGDSLDMSVQFDGTKGLWLPSVDDTALQFGNGTLSFDRKWFFGNATSYEEVDASANALRLVGSAKRTGYNRFSERFELLKVFGERGLPQLNAVSDPPAADTYNTAAMTALLIADRDFELLGTNASSDDVTRHAEGGIKLETDGASGDQNIILPHLNSNQSPWTFVTWGTDQQVNWGCHFKTGSAVTAQAIWAGLKLTNTSVVATDNDQAFVRYESGVNDGEFQAVYSIGGTDTAVDTGVVVAADTEYFVEIHVDSSRIARFYINGALVATSTALTNATDLIPYFGIQATGAAAKHCYLFQEYISRVFA